MIWNLYFITQEREWVMRIKLKLFPVSPHASGICITAVILLLFCLLVSTECSPSHASFPVSSEFTYPTSTLFIYLSSEYLLTEIQFLNLVFLLACRLAIWWGRKVWMVLDHIMITGNCLTSHQLYRLEEISQMKPYLPCLMNGIYYLRLFFESFGEKRWAYK